MPLAWFLIVCMFTGLLGCAFFLGRWSADVDAIHENETLRRQLAERERSVL